MAQVDDFTKGGAKMEGAWENDRNAANRELYKAIIKEVYGAEDCIIAHHLVYSFQEGDYFIVEEIPSADTLIFDHAVMKKLFGDGFREVLTTLALEPVETRDAKLAELYNGRGKEKTPETYIPATWRGENV